MLQSFLKGNFEKKIESIKNNLFSFVFAFFGILLLALAIFSLIFNHKKQESSSIEIISGEKEATFSAILVHLSGAVEKPGLYQLTSSSRINDALIQAGGLALEADRDWFDKNINLAEIVKDGQKVYFPFKGENEDNGQTYILGENQAKINLNTANSSQLESLSGIGPATAQKIISFRQENGSFTKIEEIMDVSGIGEATFKEIKDLITVF